MTAYPKIVAGNPTGDADIIIQAKIDGSQCSVRLTKDGLRFFNKGSPIKGNKNFQNVIVSLSNKTFFRTGFTYHGEAVCSTQHNIAKYSRTPNYFWIVYEIIRDDGTALNQQEMEAHLEGTGIEIVDLLYTGPPDKAVIEDIMTRQPETILGGGSGGFEGIVVKRLQQFPFYRRKIVSEKFREEREPIVRISPDLSDIDAMTAIGQIYNVPARIMKAKQRLRDQERDPEVLNQELDDDLIKEKGVDIKDRLICHFFNRILNGARAAYLGLPKPEEIPELIGYQRAQQSGPLPLNPNGISEFLERMRNQFTGPDGDFLRDELWRHYSSIILEASRRPDLRMPVG